MNIKLQILLIIGTLLFGTLILRLLISKKIALRYSLIWILADIAMLCSALFPTVVDKISNLLGIKTPSNFIFVFGGLFALLIILTLTAIASTMNNQIYRLTQTLSLLEKRVRELENKGDHKKNESSNSDISTDK